MLANGDMEIGGRPAAWLERRIELQGVVLRQLTAAVLVDGGALRLHGLRAGGAAGELASLKDRQPGSRIEIGTPSGSANIAKLPTPGMGVLPTSTLPPSSTTMPSVLSTEGTWK